MADENTQGGAPAALPETADVHEAVQLMNGVTAADGEGDSGEQQDEGEGQGQQEGDVQAEAGEGDEGEHQQEADAEREGEGEAEAEQQEQAAGDAPEFWSAEDKAAWAKVPPELKPVLAKYEQQRIGYVNEKVREAKETASVELNKAKAVADDSARWWQTNGPLLNQKFVDKWSTVNWGDLAEKNPAEWARLNQIRADEAELLGEAQRRGRVEIEAAQKRAVETEQEGRRTEHAKLAQKLPQYFGNGKAQETYDKLSTYLFSKGIPAQQIAGVYDSAIIEIALNSMRFEEAQKKAPTALTGKSGEGTRPAGNGAPRRVQPGPPSGGNRVVGENVRQARDRFRKSGDMRDAARLLDQLGH